jgi:hypothetical protein
MKVIVNGYVAMIDDKIAVTSLGKAGYTDFYTQAEIKKFTYGGGYRPIIYPTEKGAKSAISHELKNYEYRRIPQETIDDLKSKSKVVSVTATYEINELEAGE